MSATGAGGAGWGDSPGISRILETIVSEIKGLTWRVGNLNKWGESDAEFRRERGVIDVLRARINVQMGRTTARQSSSRLTDLVAAEGRHACEALQDRFEHAGFIEVKDRRIESFRPRLGLVPLRRGPYN